ncbi:MULTISPECIES: hypothetical protein [unclassified Streptomyces]|uniref:hypothetical protein n=1 Tax=unclassified Streptomyces TaxID=2593676 RepID=UPI00380D0D83
MALYGAPPSGNSVDHPGSDAHRVVVLVVVVVPIGGIRRCTELVVPMGDDHCAATGF